MRINARERLDFLLDKEGRTEIGAEVQPLDPLRFNDSKKYTDRVKQAKAKSNETDALVLS